MNTIKSIALAILLISFLPSFTVEEYNVVESGVEDSIEGKYEGMLTFSGSSGTVIANPAGSAEITKSGKTYTISFSDKVPSLVGLKFKDNGGSYVTIKSSNSVSGIVIDEGDLSIGVTKNGSTWAFSGKK